MSEQYFVASPVPDRTANYFCLIGNCDWFNPLMQVRFCAIYFREGEQ